MKSIRKLTVAIGLVLLASTASAMTDEGKEMMKSMAEDCRKQEGASEAEVERMTNEDYPTTKEGKCMVHCLQEQFGVTQKGEYQKDNVKSLVEMFAGEDEKKRNAAGEIAEECQNEADPDNCEKAIKIGKCLEKAGKSRGFTAPGE